MGLSTDIKAAIKAKLTGLVPTSIGQVIEQNVKKSIFEQNIAAWPVAILTPPAIDSAVLTIGDNLRTYTYNIFVIQKLDNLTDNDQLETIKETIMNAFDNDPTLAGKANGGLIPSASPSEPINAYGHDYVLVAIQLKARGVDTLS